MVTVELEKAAAGFCADVKEIARQYREESEPVKKLYTERLNEIKRLEQETREEYRDKAISINRKFKARIEQAANIRKEKYERPEQIENAARTVCLIMGGINNEYLSGMSESEADNARRIIENAERERLQAEEIQAKYSEIKPSGVW